MRSSSNSTSKTCIRPETRGYKFFCEGFLHDIWSQSTTTHFFVKCNSFRSQRKTATAHSLWVCLPLGQPKSDPVKAYCSCVAGASGFCNHIMGLLYQLSHFCKSGVKCIPDDVSKTSIAQTWDRPRIEGVSAEPVMQVVVRKGKIETEQASKSVECSL